MSKKLIKVGPDVDISIETLGKEITRGLIKAIKSHEDWHRYKLSLSFEAREHDGEIAITNIVMRQDEQDPPKKEAPAFETNFMEELRKVGENEGQGPTQISSDVKGRGGSGSQEKG